VVAVVDFWGPSEASSASEFAQSLTIIDPRIVVMAVADFRNDWQTAARCGKEFWSRAEAFVARMRKGEIEG
jgi:hypothetical protein